jgi:hypothetical protein
MELTEPFPPLCPLTGLPATRHIQQVSGELLIALWQAAFGVSTARQLRDVKRFGLMESPCGLGHTGQHAGALARSKLPVPRRGPEGPESALCSRWLTTRRMGEDAP